MNIAPDLESMDPGVPGEIKRDYVSNNSPTIHLIYSNSRLILQ